MPTNLRPGIDTPPPSNFLIAKFNVPHDDGTKLRAALADFGVLLKEILDPDRKHDGRKVVGDWAHHVLVAFGLPFFLGRLESREDSAIPNFPPGGQFPRRPATRFGLEVSTPLYLRTMNADGDLAWIKKNNPNASEEESAALYRRWLSDAECDIMVYIESNLRFINLDTWDKIRKCLCDRHGFELNDPVQLSTGREDGRDLTGWHDPRSNLEDLMIDDPAEYRRNIYLPHPAPMYPGEALQNRDPLMYNGGTYLVHRNYRLDLDRWNSIDFEFESTVQARTYRGEDARTYSIGRERSSGKVQCPFSGILLEHEKGAAEVGLALADSHIAMARGNSPAPFRGPFTPLEEPEDISVFNIQDIRIRRRGGNWINADPVTGRLTQGLHFLCFQNNIQQTGFEFINNIWLLNPMFRMRIDPILDPDKGVAEPLQGAYFFVPPMHRDFPGEIFFRKEV